MNAQTYCQNMIAPRVRNFYDAIGDCFIFMNDTPLSLCADLENEGVHQMIVACVLI